MVCSSCKQKVGVFTNICLHIVECVCVCVSVIIIVVPYYTAAFFFKCRVLVDLHLMHKHIFFDIERNCMICVSSYYDECLRTDDNVGETAAQPHLTSYKLVHFVRE